MPVKWAAILVAFLACPVRAQAPAPVHVVDIAVEPAGVRVAAVWKATGTPTPCPSDFDERTLMPGTTWFELLGAPGPGGRSDPDAEDGPPVVARGLLPGARAVVEAEDLAFRDVIALESVVPQTLVQVRLPASSEPRQMAVYRRAPAGATPARTRLALMPVPPGGARAELSFPETPVHGDRTANRAHVQLVTEGFTARGLDATSRLKPECEKLVAALLDQKPFDRYGHLLAVTVVRCPSGEAGVAREDESPRTTALEVQLQHARQDDRIVALSDGTPRWYWRSLQLPPAGFERLVRTNVSSAPQVRVVLANDSAWTGTALASESPSPVLLMGLGLRGWRFVHLLGHALGALDDEYAASPLLCDRAFAGAPNVTPAGAPLPWQPLLDAGLLGPAQAGGHLCDRAYVHPRAACLMRRDPLDAGWCEACQAALIDALHERVHLVDVAEPAERVLSLDSPAPPTFKVRVLATGAQQLKAEWILDRQPAEAIAAAPAGGADLTYRPPDELWNPGHHVVRFLVSDASPLGASAFRPTVRSFPHEVRWDVYVSAPSIAPLVPVGETFQSTAAAAP